MIFPHGTPVQWTAVSDFCNEKLEREGKTVYGCIAPVESRFHWDDKQISHDTHKALIINVEPLKCQHTNTKIWEPHLAGARKCLDCELVWNNNVGEWRCEHPKEKIKIFPYAALAQDRRQETQDKIPWQARYECECGAKVEPESFKEIK